VPVRGENVHAVEIDGEAVLLDETTGRLHLLNATGALLWACFDGKSSIAEIVTDLAEELGAPRRVVLADTLAISRQLGEEGLLADVTSARRAGEASESAAAESGTSDDPRFVPEPPNL